MSTDHSDREDPRFGHTSPLDAAPLDTAPPAATPKPAIVIGRAIALLAGAAGVTALTLIARAAGYDSIAKGAVIGGSAMLLVVAALWLSGSRFGLASRLAAGESDERESLHTTKALADAGAGMGLACIAGLIAGMYGMPAPLVAGGVLWVGLIIGVASLIIHTRRG